jgi:hypothetical protein
MTVTIDPREAFPRQYDLVHQDVNAQKAQEAGLEVYVPKDNELTLDLDNEDYEAFSIFGPSEPLGEMLNMLSRYYGTISYRPTKSKSGKVHLYITLPAPVNRVERIALQAIMGSDPKREMINLVRHNNGAMGEPILMFEVPEKKAA